MKSDQFNLEIADYFAQFALECVFREYPHAQLYLLKSREDFIPPRQLTPAFYGCLDWHSAVHNHWMLVRLIRLFPEASFRKIAQDTITQNITVEHITAEVSHLQAQPRFECPYGLAWLLQLTTELREWQEYPAQNWLEILQPLETVAIQNLQKWWQHLSYPNRTGSHAQTAFSFGLIWDWAIVYDPDLIPELAEKIRNFYLKDCNYPLHLEPWGYDFLSPTLAEADLMRRLLSREDFAEWLSQFLPEIPTERQIDWLKPVCVKNPEDYAESHFDGLNLSRAWMLEGIISGLPTNDLRIPALEAVTQVHREQSLNLISATQYSGSHWLGSFAIYLMTKRGLSM
ncbi:MAG: DUF2891 domain-containing protein [Cyanobacteria bacterium J06592_8]